MMGRNRGVSNRTQSGFDCGPVSLFVVLFGHPFLLYKDIYYRGPNYNYSLFPFPLFRFTPLTVPIPTDFGPRPTFVNTNFTVH